MPEEAIQEVTQAIELVSSKVFKSVTIGKLAAALAKAQTEFSKVLKDTKNPYYGSKYADMAGVIESTQPALAKNGLVVLQFGAADMQNKTHTLTTTLAHSSDEWISSELTVPATMMGKDKSIKFDAQSIGAAMTYCRRYSYQAIVGVAAEDDDDGNSLRGNSVETVIEYDQRTEDQKIVMPAQAQAMHEAMKRTGKSEALVSEYLKGKGYRQFEQVLRSDFQPVLKWLNTALQAPLSDDLLPKLQRSLEIAQQKPAQNDFKRIFAAAGNKNIPESDVKQWAYETFKVDSMTKLTSEQLLKVAEWVADCD